jgi:hypothetical protein
MSNRSIYNIQYNIPRPNISLPGRQNRTTDAFLKITPGMDEPIEFVFGNQDGVPINLLPFKVKIVFWQLQTIDSDEITVFQSEIILAKEFEITDPYAGRVVGLLTNEDTLTLGNVGSTYIRWGLFMINSDGQVFPAEVNRNRGRVGTVVMDLAGGMPIAEVIKSA